ncbi:MAG: hypothetical protein COS14_08560 [Bacteroidetes bacterium CG02_land_8_20_14_3_00_31_25]|nr:MAG: hypothetical protein COS14_08560 [Bacteroidetes bacterium CG02_land_8_20_14_3_00_31_25]
MYNSELLLTLLLINSFGFAQVKYEQYFIPKTLRIDFYDKFTYKLTHENQVDTICIENLAVNNMLKNHCLAQSISDVSWYKFKELLTYKCDWYGKNLITIGRFEPSSKLCTCGYLNKELKLSDRTWTCPNCNTTHDRDLLAANNIKTMGLNPKNYSGTGCSGGLLESSTIVGAKKEENILIPINV